MTIYDGLNLVPSNFVNRKGFWASCQKNIKDALNDPANIKNTDWFSSLEADGVKNDNIQVTPSYEDINSDGKNELVLASKDLKNGDVQTRIYHAKEDGSLDSVEIHFDSEGDNLIDLVATGYDTDGDNVIDKIKADHFSGPAGLRKKFECEELSLYPNGKVKTAVMKIDADDTDGFEAKCTQNYDENGNLVEQKDEYFDEAGKNISSGICKYTYSQSAPLGQRKYPSKLEVTTFDANGKMIQSETYKNENENGVFVNPVAAFDAQYETVEKVDYKNGLEVQRIKKEDLNENEIFEKNVVIDSKGETTYIDKNENGYDEKEIFVSKDKKKETIKTSTKDDGAYDEEEEFVRYDDGKTKTYTKKTPLNAFDLLTTLLASTVNPGKKLQKTFTENYSPEGKLTSRENDILATKSIEYYDASGKITKTEMLYDSDFDSIYEQKEVNETLADGTKRAATTFNYNRNAKTVVGSRKFEHETWTLTEQNMITGEETSKVEIPPESMESVVVDVSTDGKKTTTVNWIPKKSISISKQTIENSDGSSEEILTYDKTLNGKADSSQVNSFDVDKNLTKITIYKNPDENQYNEKIVETYFKLVGGKIVINKGVTKTDVSPQNGKPEFIDCTLFADDGSELVNVEYKDPAENEKYTEVTERTYDKGILSSVIIKHNADGDDIYENIEVVGMDEDGETSISYKKYTATDSKASEYDALGGIPTSDGRITNVIRLGKFASSALLDDNDKVISNKIEKLY